ncbi:hypothetical protein AWB75_00715 [Caballeronia catudaia]|uniref:Uncharacterized protein n=1 Tax=Caballeronia catudaia TaxID=1777136 RepID=A0A157ZGL5_9BURK|nr:hypothetical protein [Caballeronia catudaia]SAK44589.1 hypothetical protein AWB75_00715 [Caballeronia catudaia]
MTEDLIEVEGNLRLPTLRALMDPLLNYGREWSPAFSRPLQSGSEFALFAAQFRTAYVPALSLSDTNSPYGATSLWGVFAKEHIPRAMLRLMEGKHPDEAGIDRAAPVHLNVGAPMAPGAGKRYFSKPVAALTAVACAALIAWLFFEYDRDAPGNSRAAPAMEVRVQSPEPDVNTQPDRPESSSAAAAGIAAVETGIAARPANDIQPSQAATPPEPASANANVIASENAPAATKREASGVHLIAETTVRRRNGRVSAVLAPRTQQTAAVRAPKADKPATDKHFAKRETAAHARAPSARVHADRASKISDPMNAAALYAMLQHSPTLDSNAGGASSRGGAKTQNAR